MKERIDVKFVEAEALGVLGGLLLTAPLPVLRRERIRRGNPCRPQCDRGCSRPTPLGSEAIVLMRDEGKGR